MPPTSWEEILKLIAFSFGSVIALFIIAKLLGKKQIAQLGFIDYVLGISIGSIAANMSTDTSDHPFYFYLIGMFIFFLVAWLIDFLERKGPIVKSFLKGNPIIIIKEGKIDYKALKKSKLDINDMVSLCRDKGFFDISKVAYAIFENSGKLSVMPNGAEQPLVMSDVTSKIEQPTLIKYLITDGKISYSELFNIDKTEEWLFKKLNIRNKKQLKRYLLVSYNEDSDELNVQRKDN